MAYRDSTAENREYWKSEMGQALREIQDAYDDKMDVMRGELETYYNLKVYMGGLSSISVRLHTINFLFALLNFFYKRKVFNFFLFSLYFT